MKDKLKTLQLSGVAKRRLWAAFPNVRPLRTQTSDLTGLFCTSRKERLNTEKD